MKQFLIVFAAGFTTTVWATSPFDACQQAAAASDLTVVACHAVK